VEQVVDQMQMKKVVVVVELVDLEQALLTTYL
jgi:hypothetical protein